MSNPKPFLKWVGGKRQLLKEITKYIPKEIGTYYEPFVGGGAVLFQLSPKKAVINDYNSELITTYKVLSNKEETKKLKKLLLVHEKNNTKEYYYKIRAIDRDKNKYNNLTNVEKAARMIFLNKTSFNGMYRVNMKNQFNVPYNNNINVKTYDDENFIALNEYFSKNNITILNGDFEEAIKDAKAGDFVYFDPPYDTIIDDKTLENKKNFTSYTDKGFTREDQKRLFKCYKELSDRGVYVMLSNHNTKFINKLYESEGFTKIEVQATRMINANGKKRSKVPETIIINKHIINALKEKE